MSERTVIKFDAVCCACVPLLTMLTLTLTLTFKLREKDVTYCFREVVKNISHFLS